MSGYYESGPVCYDPSHEEGLERLRAELARWIEAFGLLSTLHGKLVININDPMGMAQAIEKHVRAEVEQYRQDAERYRWLRQNAEAIQISYEYDGNIGATPWIEATGFDNYFDAALRGGEAG